MKSRLTAPCLLLLSLAALLFPAGCDRLDNAAPQTAELDEPGYRRAKELERQGRDQEAISELEKVLDKRGLNNSPETHLELGLLYQQHMRDPLAAIYHFQKYRLLRPNSDRETLVQQRIEVSRRDYATTLPGRPSIDTTMPNAAPPDQIARLQAENDRLRALLAANTTSEQPIVATSMTPIAIAPAQTPETTPAPPPPLQTQTQQLQPRQTQPQQPPPPPPRPAPRTYKVKPHDNLFNIARQAYGTASNAQIDAIVNANRDILTSGRHTILREGMTLTLP